MPYQPDAELAKRDPTLKGLPILLNPESFLEAIRPLLREVNDVNIEAVKGVDVRYKPSIYCLVLYELRVNGKKVYAYAIGFHSSSRSRFLRNHKHLKVSGPINLGRLILEKHSIVVNFFPNDNKLKFLSHIDDTEFRKGILRKSLPDNPSFWESRLEYLKYIPERRFVSKLINNRGDKAALKIFRDRDFFLAWENVSAFKSYDPLVIAKLLGHYERRRILIFEWLPGEQLNNALSVNKLDFGTVEIVGAALARLHNQRTEKLTCLTREKEAASIKDVAKMIAVLCPPFADRAHNIAYLLSSFLFSKAPIFKPIHGDFYAKQVLINNGQISILDFDQAVLGDPAYDLGNFIAHLELDVIRGNVSSNCVGSLGNSLFEGYKAGKNNHIPTLPKYYIASGLFRLATEPFRLRETNWLESTELILDRVESILKTVSNRVLVGPFNFVNKRSSNRD